jgi:phosphoribosylformylglycinamidine synthase PurS subunit
VPGGAHTSAVPVGRPAPDDIALLTVGGYVARMIVEVMLKPEIHDPQGDAIAGACHRLGFGQVLGVRQGKRFEVELEGPADEAAVTAITNLARDLLSNPVIEEFTLHAG